MAAVAEDRSAHDAQSHGTHGPGGQGVNGGDAGDTLRQSAGRQQSQAGHDPKVAEMQDPKKRLAQDLLTLPAQQPCEIERCRKRRGGRACEAFGSEDPDQQHDQRR